MYFQTVAAAPGEHSVPLVTTVVAVVAVVRVDLRVPQNSRLTSLASMAPGTTSMIPLSTISMTAIDTVSAASAT